MRKATLSMNNGGESALMLAAAEDLGDDDGDGSVVLPYHQEAVEITFDLGLLEEKVRRYLCRINRIAY